MAEMVDILVIAAIKGEIASLIKFLSRESTCLVWAGRTRIFEMPKNTRIAIHVCGVGRKKAISSIRGVLSRVEPSRVLIAGWAGSLREDFRPRDLICVSRVCCENSSPGSAEPLRLDNDEIIEIFRKTQISLREGNLVSVSSLVDKTEIKEHLRQNYGCQIVDMESYFISEILHSKGIPTSIIRVVSDTADERIGVDFDKLPAGRSRRIPYFIKHPDQCFRYFQLIMNLRKCSSILSSTVIVLLRRKYVF